MASGKVYQFAKIADGVYYATSDGPMATGGNHPIIVNENDVLLVDDGTTPAAARALLEDLKLITNKPVRWVVNTHFHYDHTDGNSIFGPLRCRSSATNIVRKAILDDVLHHEPFLTSVGNRANEAEAVKKQIAERKRRRQRASLQTQLAAAQADLAELKNIKPTPPTMTYSSKMTLYSGQREIQIFVFRARPHAGRHCRLSSERTNRDLGRPHLIAPGVHGQRSVRRMGDDAGRGQGTGLRRGAARASRSRSTKKSLITAFQSYLKDLMTQVAALRKQGLSAEQAAQKVDLTSTRRIFRRFRARAPT